jgi:16S rRNA (guanine527-N7)-methyltransferase
MSVSRETDEKLKMYLALLEKWQPKINLISNNTLDNAWERHFEDSLQVLDLLPEGENTLYDLGTGAGFPGLVLAIARDDLDVHLVESDQKKCVFLKTVSRETKTPVEIHNCRIEAVSRETDEVPAPDIITARALANLSELFEYCADWIEGNPDITLIFMKGENADQEIQALEGKWKFNCRTCASKTAENAKILLFTDIYRM